MQHSTTTMPRKKYTALDIQHLTTSSSRSTSPLHTAPESCDFFLSAPSCIPRDRAVSLPLSTERDPLKLPDYCIPKPTSISALELLRFGSLEKAVKPSPDKELLPPEKPPEPPEPLVFAESDFPPLTKFPLHTSDLVDIKSGRRCITLPEFRQRQYHRASSAPLRKPENRNRKQTSRSVRYSNNGTDSQGNRKTPSVLIEPGDTSPERVADKPSRRDSLCPPVEVSKRRARNDMASAFPQMSGDARRHYPSGSTRFENRPPVNRATPCKNGPLCRKFQEGWIQCPL
jgi:hypothetical protein